MKYIVLLCIAIVHGLNAQFTQRKLGPALNNPSFNYWAPFVSLDGNTLVFMYDYTEDNTAAPFISLREGVDWKEPIQIPKKFTALSLLKGYSLSPDGNQIYFTSKGGTIGGFDIYTSQIIGTTFSEPISIGAPINSSTNDGCPTFSPDGSKVFFMRCGKMDFNGADDCKIFMATKRNGLWETPVELPAKINKGNSQMPRILADGQTLIFSSNKHLNSKGGMDLYMTKLDGNDWSEPANMEFVNSPEDEIYASANSIGMNLLKDAQGPKKRELVEFQFPQELKPKAVIRVIGLVEGIQDLTKARITVVDLITKQIYARADVDKKGNFTCFIPEGKVYGLFVDPPTDQFGYFGKKYDLTEGNKVPNFERVKASLKPVKAGDQIMLSGVSFKPSSNEIEQTSVIDLQKISKMIRGNSKLKFNVDVTLYGLEKDSIQREDLTEVMSDTVVYEKEFQIDSVTTEMRDSIVIEYTYHNDRTEKQASAIADFIVKQGVPPESISTTYKALVEPVAEKRRTIIYLKVH